MNVLIVYAHPEPRSLNGAIRDFCVERLRRAGHDVRVSDLYAMHWKASVDAADFPDRNTNEPLNVSAASKHAYETATQTAEVAAEQKKLLQADTLILQFPLWWFSMPAILKPETCSGVGTLRRGRASLALRHGRIRKPWNMAAA